MLAMMPILSLSSARADGAVSPTAAATNNNINNKCVTGGEFSARPRASGDPVLDSRLCGNERVRPPPMPCREFSSGKEYLLSTFRALLRSSASFARDYVFCWSWIIRAPRSSSRGFPFSARHGPVMEGVARGPDLAADIPGGRAHGVGNDGAVCAFARAFERQENADRADHL